MNDIIQTLAIWALPLLFAITLHEVAHGWMARQLGDPTAEQMGRLTLNPIKHIDPLGTIVIPAAMLALGGFVFGWAKPVPVNMNRLRNPLPDMAVVAAAGPLANLVMALGWALIAKIGVGLYGTSTWVATPMILMGQAGITINLILCLLNLLPLPPLDGGRVLAGFLPRKAAYAFSRIEPFGFFIIIALLASGVLGKILVPPFMAMSGFISSLFGLHF